MIEIELTQGYKATVDDDDFKIVNQYRWQIAKCSKSKYAKHGYWQGMIYMHRLIMGITDSKIRIDHIDGNGLNNCKSNLRICTHQQNIRNQNKKHGSSKYKGVYYSKKCKKWTAQITVNYKSTNLGFYKTEEDAAKVYNKTAIKCFGEFAKLNLIQ